MSRASTVPGSRPLPPTRDRMDPGGKRGAVVAPGCCAPPPLPLPFRSPPTGPLPFAPCPRAPTCAASPTACWPRSPCVPSGGGGGGGTPSWIAGSGLIGVGRPSRPNGWCRPVKGVVRPGAGVSVAPPTGLSPWRPSPWYAPRAAASARAASTAAGIIMSDCLATARSSLRTVRTIAPRSSRGAPARVRLRTAAFWTLRNSSSNRRRPRVMGMEPPATQARRANTPKPRSGDSTSPTPPPADTCATCMSSPSHAAPSRKSAAALSPSVVPHLPPLILLANEAALDSVLSGGWPASSLTAGASATSAVITASTSRVTSSRLLHPAAAPPRLCPLYAPVRSP
eukprot:3828511-Pleurochrysis_carterae.AAC.4